jgi:hypothetical protein
MGWGEAEAGWWSASNLQVDLVDKVKLYRIVTAWSSIAATQIVCSDIIKSVESDNSVFQTFSVAYWAGMLLSEGRVVG